MADYIYREYDLSRVRSAGKALTGKVSVSDETVENFRVAHNFRMAHAFPLTIERSSLARLSGQAADTSGRIKRMSSIRKKLANSKLHLDKIQDIAGIRCIMPSMSEVRRVHDHYCQRHGETIKQPIDYILNPKETGYRSVHIVKTYTGSVTQFVGMKVEVQIRTRLQHVWAAAQETIGIITSNDLKGGRGDPRWQRLMAVVSAFVADIERQPIGDFVSHDRRKRRRELQELERELDALRLLRGVKAIAPVAQRRATRGGFFLMAMDADRATIKVIPIQPTTKDARHYFEAQDRGERVQSLMVAVDDMTALMRTYPSYFLDVSDFIQILQTAVDGTHMSMAEDAIAPTVTDSNSSATGFDFLKDGTWRRPRTGQRRG